MSIPVPTRWHVPGVSQSFTGAPVVGRTLVGMAGALTHLTAVQCRGFTAAVAYQGTGGSADGYYTASDLEAHETADSLVWVGAGVSRLAVYVTYLARSSGDAPSIAASLCDASLVEVDAGWRVERNGGLGLPTDSFRARQTYLRPVTLSPVMRPPADIGVQRTVADLLSTDGASDVMMVVRVVAELARIVSVYVLPEPLLVV